MAKIKLSFCRDDMRNWSKTLGFDYIINPLRDSDVFDISYHEESLDVMRGYRATIIHVNDKKIYMDFWEYPTPTYTAGVVNANFDLIIKLQHKAFSNEYFESVCQRKKWLIELSKDQRIEFLKKIEPFTFFPSRMVEPFVGKESEIPEIPIKQMGFFCGKTWKCRIGMRKCLLDKNIEILESKIGEDNLAMSDSDYLQKMFASKFGVVLHGRGSPLTDVKNRREIDYMIMKKPLLLNYFPYYFNPLIEGVHFIHIDEKTDFLAMEKLYNIKEIANNGHEWYKKNASPLGVVKTFLELLGSRNII